MIKYRNKDIFITVGLSYHPCLQCSKRKFNKHLQSQFFIMVVYTYIVLIHFFINKKRICSQNTIYFFHHISRLSQFNNL